jgi:cellulose synthase/poly-beta-1,6-N-acetylglucosamine synthase-like glycosyltransferase
MAANINFKWVELWQSPGTLPKFGLKHIFVPMNISQITEHWQLIVFIAFFTVGLIQLFYFLFFFSRLAFHTDSATPTSQTHPVSVIICARDEAPNLSSYLESVLGQDYPTTHEVIVVNDNSYDDSKYILEELQRSHKQLQIVELTQEAKMIPGKKFPLSIGIKTAKHEIVLLTDADCSPATNKWIESMQAAYRDNTEIVLGYGAFHKKDGLLNKIIRWETFHSALQYLSYALAKVPYMGVGRNLSYKKAVFFRHKGFSSHNNIPGGDDDLFINMAATNRNTRINTDPGSFTLSNAAENWKQWTTQKKRHYTTSRYYKPKHKFLLGLYSLSHFLFYPLLVSSCLFYNWQYALAVFGARFIVQSVVYWRTLKKLQETDLFPFFLFFDLWMFFYYFIFAPSLVNKPKPTWK